MNQPLLQIHRSPATTAKQVVKQPPPGLLTKQKKVEQTRTTAVPAPQIQHKADSITTTVTPPKQKENLTVAQKHLVEGESN